MITLLNGSNSLINQRFILEISFMIEPNMYSILMIVISKYDEKESN